MKIILPAQMIVFLQENVKMVILQTVLMMIAVQSHGLVMDLKIVKIRPMAVI